MIHLMKLFALSFTLLIAGCSLVLEDPRPYPEARRLDAAMMPVDMAPPPVDMAPPPRRDLSVRRPMDAALVVDAMVNADATVDAAPNADATVDAAPNADAEAASDARAEREGDGAASDGEPRVDDAARTDGGDDAGAPD